MKKERKEPETQHCYDFDESHGAFFWRELRKQLCFCMISADVLTLLELRLDVLGFLFLFFLFIFFLIISALIISTLIIPILVVAAIAIAFFSFFVVFAAICPTWSALPCHR